MSSPLCVWCQDLGFRDFFGLGDFLGPLNPKPQILSPKPSRTSGPLLKILATMPAISCSSGMLKSLEDSSILGIGKNLNPKHRNPKHHNPIFLTYTLYTQGGNSLNIPIPCLWPDPLRPERPAYPPGNP